MPIRIGSEFLVNTGNTFGTQGTPDIAGTQDGGLVVAWRSEFRPDSPEELDFEIQARALLPGSADTGEFRVNRLTTDAQFSPTVASRADGSFAIAYSSGEENRLEGTSVNTQFLDAAGRLTGPENLTDYDYYHWSPEIAAFADGGVVTVWSGEFEGEGEIRSADGSLLSEFTFGWEGAPGPKAVAVLSDESFVVSWYGYRSEAEAMEGGDTGFYGQIQQRSGAAGPVFEVGDAAGGRPDPAIARLANGNFVLVWTAGLLAEDPMTGEGANVMARIFTPDGDPVGDAFVVHEGLALDQHNADVAALSDGRFVVVWQDGADDAEQASPVSTIRGQVFDADGLRIGGEFQANADSPVSSVDPSIASLGGDRFAIAWTGDEGALGVDGGIKVQMFAVDDAPEGETITGTGGADRLVGTLGDDLILGGAGPDQLFGSAGDDRILGEKGEDSQYGGLGDDELLGGWQSDVLHGELGDDVLFGDNPAIGVGSRGGNDQLFGEEGNDVLYGDGASIAAGGRGGNDILVGGSGNDLLFGDGAPAGPLALGGHDTIVGGEGNDQMWGGGGNDVFVFKGSTWSDTIWDFGQEEGDNDLLDLRGTDAAFQGNLQIFYVGGNAIVDFGSGQVTLIGVTHLETSDYMI